jgi:capsular exopolysaccharide synthesis family protein
MKTTIATVSEEEFDLKWFLAIFSRYWLIFVLAFGSIFALLTYRVLRQTRIYESSGELIFDASNRISRLTGVAGDQISSISDPLATQAQIIRSQGVIKRAIAQLESADPPIKNLSREEIVENLTVQPIRSTYVIRISFRTDDPELAAKVVNALMNAYISQDLDSTRSTTRAAREFIAQQLPKVEAELEQAELNLQKFRDQNGIINLATEAEAATNRVSDLESQITEVKSLLASATTEAEDLVNQIGIPREQALVLARLSQSEGVQKILSEAQKIEEQLVVQKTLYKSSHPLIMRLERQQEELQSLLADRIRGILRDKLPDDIQLQLDSNLLNADGRLQLGELELSLVSQLVATEIKKNSLISRKAELESSLLAYLSRAKELAELERTQNQLLRKIEVNRITYEGLLKKLQEVQLAENQQVGNVRILSAAEPPIVPVSPNIPRSLVLAVVAGLVGAGSIVWLINSLDNVLRSVELIVNSYGYPMLAVLPRLNGNGNGRRKKTATVAGIYVRDNPRAPASEAYRTLQTSLRFISSDQPLRSIVVTSAMPSEGKSTVTANLAAAMAQSGRRVLIVDADLRRSDQFSLWNTPRFPGLTEVLVGEQNWQQAIELVMPNLFLLPSGTTSPNPISLFDSRRLLELVKEWEDAFDYVLIDSPPLLAVADALLLVKASTGMLLVARVGVLNFPAIERAKALLQQSDIKVQGLVINDVSATSNDYYYYYHYYTDNSQEQK